MEHNFNARTGKCPTDPIHNVRIHAEHSILVLSDFQYVFVVILLNQFEKANFVVVI